MSTPLRIVSEPKGDDGYRDYWSAQPGDMWPCPHADHDDHWRWTLDAWRTPWLGGDILVLENDPEAPGILMLLRTNACVYYSDFDLIHATAAPRS